MLRSIAVMSLFSMVSGVFAFAAPTDFKLVSPKKIEVVSGKKELKLTLELPCKNDWALDWSAPILSNDDSGDFVVVIGVAVAMSECRKGPAHEFTLTVDPSGYGYTINEDITFEPMEIAE